jgi:hypothetical protein
MFICNLVRVTLARKRNKIMTNKKKDSLEVLMDKNIDLTTSFLNYIVPTLRSATNTESKKIFEINQRIHDENSLYYPNIFRLTFVDLEPSQLFSITLNKVDGHIHFVDSSARRTLAKLNDISKIDDSIISKNLSKLKFIIKTVGNETYYIITHDLSGNSLKFPLEEDMNLNLASNEERLESLNLRSSYFDLVNAHFKKNIGKINNLELRLDVQNSTNLFYTANYNQKLQKYEYTLETNINLTPENIIFKTIHQTTDLNKVTSKPYSYNKVYKIALVSGLVTTATIIANFYGRRNFIQNIIQPLSNFIFNRPGNQQVETNQNNNNNELVVHNQAQDDHVTAIINLNNIAPANSNADNQLVATTNNNNPQTEETVVAPDNSNTNDQPAAATNNNNNNNNPQTEETVVAPDNSNTNNQPVATTNNNNNPQTEETIVAPDNSNTNNQPAAATNPADEIILSDPAGRDESDANDSDNDSKSGKPVGDLVHPTQKAASHDEADSIINRFLGRSNTPSDLSSESRSIQTSEASQSSATAFRRIINPQTPAVNQATTPNGALFTDESKETQVNPKSPDGSHVTDNTIEKTPAARRKKGNNLAVTNHPQTAKKTQNDIEGNQPYNTRNPQTVRKLVRKPSLGKTAKKVYTNYKDLNDDNGHEEEDSVNNLQPKQISSHEEFNNILKDSGLNLNSVKKNNLKAIIANIEDIEDGESKTLTKILTNEVKVSKKNKEKLQKLEQALKNIIDDVNPNSHTSSEEKNHKKELLNYTNKVLKTLIDKNEIKTIEEYYALEGSNTSGKHLNHKAFAKALGVDQKLIKIIDDIATDGTESLNEEKRYKNLFKSIGKGTHSSYISYIILILSPFLIKAVGASNIEENEILDSFVNEACPIDHPYNYTNARKAEINEKNDSEKIELSSSSASILKQYFTESAKSFVCAGVASYSNKVIYANSIYSICKNFQPENIFKDFVTSSLSLWPYKIVAMPNFLQTPAVMVSKLALNSYMDETSEKTTDYLYKLPSTLASAFYSELVTTTFKLPDVSIFLLKQVLFDAIYPIMEHSNLNSVVNSIFRTEFNSEDSLSGVIPTSEV